MKWQSILVLAILSTGLNAAGKKITTAEELVGTKKLMDITYKEQMELYGSAMRIIQSAIITRNRMLAKKGADLILTHPAPRSKPWSIMPTDEDKKGMKKSLLMYSKVFKRSLLGIKKAADRGNWLDANKAAYELSNACVSCHARWKNKAISTSIAVKQMEKAALLADKKKKK